LDRRCPTPSATLKPKNYEFEIATENLTSFNIGPIGLMGRLRCFPAPPQNPKVSARIGWLRLVAAGCG